MELKTNDCRTIREGWSKVIRAECLPARALPGNTEALRRNEKKKKPQTNRKTARNNRVVSVLRSPGAAGTPPGSAGHAWDSEVTEEAARSPRCRCRCCTEPRRSSVRGEQGAGRSSGLVLCRSPERRRLTTWLSSVPSAKHPGRIINYYHHQSVWSSGGRAIQSQPDWCLLVTFFFIIILRIANSYTSLTVLLPSDWQIVVCINYNHLHFVFTGLDWAFRQATLNFSSKSIVWRSEGFN